MNSTAPANALTLYRNGSVYSSADPFATAMLVDGGTVAWVGSEHAATSIQDDKMQVVDLQGALVAPGFVDSHVHLTETGLAASSVDLSGVRSLAEMLDAVAAESARTSGVIIGHGWDESGWPDHRVPTAAELDRASGNRSVYLARADVHCAVVSGTLAAELGLAALDGWEDGFVTGYTMNYTPVRFPSERDRHNELVTVRITGAEKEQDACVGTLLSE